MRSKRILLLPLAIVAGLAVWMGCQTAKSSNPPSAPVTVEKSTPAPPTAPMTTTSAPPVTVAALEKSADPNDPRIAFWTAALLGQYHYLQRPLDKELSEKFFDEYINWLDSRHENFLQSDLDEFNIYRTNLDTLTLGRGRAADLTPAYAIYCRLVQRLRQHSDYVNELLRQNHFKFNTDEKILVDRRHAPFPKNMTEAKALWKQQLRYEYLQEKLSEELTETNGVITVNPSVATNIVDKLTRHYRWAMRVMTSLDGDKILQGYLEALAHAYDPHTDYFSAPKAQDFSIDMGLSLLGIGAQLGEDDGYCTIMELVPGGPADKSKQLHRQDRIIAVAQGDQSPVDVVEMDLEKVVQMIRGPKGTVVRLTISPASDPAARRVVTLTRDEIKLEDREAKAQLIIQPDGRRLGVLDVPSFYAAMDGSGQSFVSDDTAKLIAKLKREKVDGIVLDLRSNPGGSLEEAVKFAGLFIKDGPIVLARNAENQIGTDSDDDSDVLYDGPLVVLVNRWSASASEIVAAALQDYGRAVIVGDTSTFGKGTIQGLNRLRPFIWPATPDATNDPGTLKITKGKFYRVTGASTQFKGVASDIALPDLLDHISSAGETALDNPLPWDTIPPVDFDKLNLVQPYLAELRRRSAARVATNQDFIYIRQDIAQYEKLQADKSASINENEAIRQREKVAAQNHLRDEELQKRPAPADKIYDLTVEKWKDPGLPAPESYFATNVVSVGEDDSRLYYFNQTNFFALPQTPLPDLSAQGTNVVAVWKNPEVKLPVNPDLLSGLTLSDKMLAVTNPVVLQRLAPDATLDEAENILDDYISLLQSSNHSPQIVSHDNL